MEPMPANPPRSWLRTAIRIGAIIAFALVIHQLLNWLNLQISEQDSESTKLMLTGMILMILLVYALLIAIPFVPGIEIGLSLLLLQGPAFAPLVYLFTVLGLSLAYLIGRFVPYSYIYRILADLGLKRACDLVSHLQGQTTAERLDLLSSKLPKIAAPVLLKWRYVVLAAAINIPGNALIGGGGGICMMAGLSRLFTPSWSMLTLALAVAPVPMFAYFFGPVPFLGSAI